MTRHHMTKSILFFLSCIILCTACAGCQILGVVAYKVLPPERIKPKYIGLQGQTVGVMVWVNRGPQYDYPSLPIDMANSLEGKLNASLKEPELKGTQFPVPPESILAYQKDHPNIDLENIAVIAPNLGVSRLIYIEVEDIATHPPTSQDLYRGSMTVTMKIVEVINGVGKIAYEENNIKAVYPPKVTDDGTPDGNEYVFYRGTVDAMSTQLLWKVVSHESDDL